MEVMNVIVIAIVALMVGLLIGYSIGNSGSNDSSVVLKEQLADAQRELEQYKQQVTDRFGETATLVHQLTTSYRNLHHHLAGSAETLCSDSSIAESLLAPVSDAIEADTITETKDEVKAPAKGTVTNDIMVAKVSSIPRDYAPKSPDQEGTLSENYGIKAKADKEKEKTSTKKS